MNKAIGKVTMVCVCLALPLMGSSRDAGAQGACNRSRVKSMFSRSDKVEVVHAEPSDNQ